MNGGTPDHVISVRHFNTGDGRYGLAEELASMGALRIVLFRAWHRDQDACCSIQVVVGFNPSTDFPGKKLDR
jgi:hypothetical protein